MVVCASLTSQEAVLDAAAPVGAVGPGARPTAAAVNDVYTFGETLGTGGFAVVRRATHRASGKTVAMKVMNLPSGKDKQSERDDIFHEIGLLSKLDSDFVIRSDEFFVEGDKVYLATELLAGGDLLDAVMEAGNYDESMARRIFKRVLLGMDYIHGMGITHRDMKLENLLLADRSDLDSVKICDLGLAKKSTEKIMETVCGTPQYVSPEVITSQPGSSFGPGVDNWACGVILYILLSGYPPFAAQSEKRLYKLIKAGKYSFDLTAEDGSNVWNAVSNEAKDLIGAFLTVDESKRMTASEGLNHPWFSVDGLSADLSNAQTQLKRNYRRIFKSAVKAVMSTKRMSKLMAGFSGASVVDEGGADEGADQGAANAVRSNAVELPAEMLDSLSKDELETMKQNASTYARMDNVEVEGEDETQSEEAAGSNAAPESETAALDAEPEPEKTEAE